MVFDASPSTVHFPPIWNDTVLGHEYLDIHQALSALSVLPGVGGDADGLRVGWLVVTLRLGNIFPDVFDSTPRRSQFMCPISRRSADQLQSAHERGALWRAHTSRLPGSKHRRRSLEPHPETVAAGHPASLPIAMPAIPLKPIGRQHCLRHCEISANEVAE